MKSIRIPVGISGFAQLRGEGCYYVDKTGLIEELLETHGYQVTLITRPRRFGKTLAMSMLSEFFDIRKDSRQLFEGLSILRNQELCDAWMNQYPTLFLSFKDVGGSSYESAFGMLRAVIGDACVEHSYLGSSERVDEADRQRFAELKAWSADRETVIHSIALLTRMMQAHYGKPVIVLIDEYDVPIARASDSRKGKKDYYNEMMEVIRPLISAAIKDNPALKMAVITGCLRIARESIFTGANNMVSNTISDTRLNDCFGFTQKEVDQLLTDADLTSHREEIRKWYDGYCFGGTRIYCPWDVMNHVSRLTYDPDAQPVSYWKNSSDNAIIRSFLDFAGETVSQKFETLLAGGTILQKIEEDLTYDYLHSSEENLWSILYLTGYLTSDPDQASDQGSPDQEETALVIPNAEVQEIFESTIRVWFADSAKEWNRKALFAAVWCGDEKTVTVELTRLLRRTISYHDYREDFYHAFFAGIFAGAGYSVESNREHGEGRSDIIVKDYPGDRAAVFEVKYSGKQSDMEKDCDTALHQIDAKFYSEDLRNDYAEILCYGISFYRKRCLVKRKAEETSPPVCQI